jgi:uncharacterized protein YdhG (YjbR/CyaY superfamily)
MRGGSTWWARWQTRIQGEADVRAKIAEMPEDDRAMATRVHEIVLAAAPELAPRTFYGMPADTRDGKVICFFQSKTKFKLRYSTLGFQQDARLDEGEMWPAAFALTGLTAATEKRIAEFAINPAPARGPTTAAGDRRSRNARG